MNDLHTVEKFFNNSNYNKMSSEALEINLLNFNGEFMEEFLIASLEKMSEVAIEVFYELFDEVNLSYKLTINNFVKNITYDDLSLLGRNFRFKSFFNNNESFSFYYDGWSLRRKLTKDNDNIHSVSKIQNFMKLSESEQREHFTDVFTNALRIYFYRLVEHRSKSLERCDDKFLGRMLLDEAKLLHEEYKERSKNLDFNLI